MCRLTCRMASSVDDKADAPDPSNDVVNADSWSSAAKGYKDFSQFTLECALAGLDAARVRPGERLLDVATGPGLLAMHAALEKQAIVDAIDFSPGMIDQLRKTLSREPAAVTPHVMDGQKLEFEDSTFDVVISSFGVTLFPDYKRGLQEMVRVAKPGGRIVVVGPSEGGVSCARPWVDVVEAQFPEGLPLPFPAGFRDSGSPSGMHAVLSSAGCVDVKASELQGSIRMGESTFMFMSWVRSFMSNPFIAHVKKRLTPERAEEMEEVFLREFQTKLVRDDGSGWGYDCTFMVGCAKKP